MNDLISRQAAIKNAHFPMIDDAGYEVVRVDDILALPSAEPKTGGWIPVSERLPKEREEVLVTVSNEFETFADVDSWMGGSFWTYIDAVTAWMPLPEPYKGDSNAD